MRQSGILAAAALYALDHHIDRLELDHENAQTLAHVLDGAGPVEVEPGGLVVPQGVVAGTAGQLGPGLGEGVPADGLEQGVAGRHPFQRDIRLALFGQRDLGVLDLHRQCVATLFVNHADQPIEQFLFLNMRHPEY